MKILIFAWLIGLVLQPLALIPELLENTEMLAKLDEQIAEFSEEAAQRIRAIQSLNARLGWLRKTCVVAKLNPEALASLAVAGESFARSQDLLALEVSNERPAAIEAAAISVAVAAREPRGDCRLPGNLRWHTEVVLRLRAPKGGSIVFQRSSDIGWSYDDPRVVPL